MDSISTAACIIGIISFSFECNRLCYKASKDKEYKKHETVTSSLSPLVSSIEILYDILQDLKTEPRNTMIPLPTELEVAAQACASNLSHLERWLRESHQKKSEKWGAFIPDMELGEKHVREMYAILQTHINALGPYAPSYSSKTDSKELEETNHVPKRMIQHVRSENSTRVMPGCSQHVIRYLDKESRGIQVLHEQGRISSYVKTIVLQLQDGEIKYSSPQLYQLLNLLKEISLDTDAYAMEQLKREKTPDVEEADYAWLHRKSRSYLRRLSNLASTPSTAKPSAKAYETIVALELLIKERQRSSNHGDHILVESQGKRKAETEPESETSSPAEGARNIKRVRRMSVEFRLYVSFRGWRGDKRPAIYHACGRAADDED